jgi:hypothetical protein
MSNQQTRRSGALSRTWVGTESLRAFYFYSVKTIHIIFAFFFGLVPRPCSAMCHTICPFSCLPERRETQHAMVYQPRSDSLRALEDPLRSLMSANFHQMPRLLIIIIIIHGVLVGLFDLSDESAL